jgi:hypothetical protein
MTACEIYIVPSIDIKAILSEGLGEGGLGYEMYQMGVIEQKTTKRSRCKK